MQILGFSCISDVCQDICFELWRVTKRVTYAKSNYHKVLQTCVNPSPNNRKFYQSKGIKPFKNIVGKVENGGK